MSNIKLLGDVINNTNSVLICFNSNDSIKTIEILTDGYTNRDTYLVSVIDGKLYHNFELNVSTLDYINSMFCIGKGICEMKAIELATKYDKAKVGKCLIFVKMFNHLLRIIHFDDKICKTQVLPLFYQRFDPLNNEIQNTTDPEIRIIVTELTKVLGPKHDYLLK